MDVKGNNFMGKIGIQEAKRYTATSQVQRAEKGKLCC